MGMLIAQAMFSVLPGLGIGLLEVGLFYHPDRAIGVTRRLYHLMFAGSLLAIGGVMLAMAMGIYVQPDTPRHQQQATAMGLFIGYAAGGGFLASRRRRRARALWAARSAEASAAAPVSRATPAAPRTVARRMLRTVDYCFGLTLCAAALAAGVTVGHAAQTWLEQARASVFVVFVAVHLSTFVYGQLISGKALKQLNVAVRDDWRVRRRGQFVLAGGPLVYAIPMSAVLSIGTAVGLTVQLVALWVGYRFTDGPPDGMLKTLRAYRAAQSLKASESEGAAL